MSILGNFKPTSALPLFLIIYGCIYLGVSILILVKVHSTAVPVCTAELSLLKLSLPVASTAVPTPDKEIATGKDVNKLPVVLPSSISYFKAKE